MMVQAGKSITEKVKKIHESLMYGSVIELGSGCCVSNALLSVEGATKTIYECKVPYSKEAQAIYAFPTRSVSKDAVAEILRDEYFKSLKKPTNFCLATSFQLQGEGETNLTHGFIGFAYKDEAKIYHISIPEFYKDDYRERTSRNIFLEKIAEVAIEIMYSALIDKPIESKYIDSVNNVNETTTENITKTIKILDNLHEGDNFLVFTPDHKMIRFEDLVRDKPGLIILKGSFNPIHERHVMMMEDTKKLYPDYAACFSCSIERYDKPDISINELIDKIKKINDLGYYFCLNRNKYFTGTVAWIRQRWKLPVILPVGVDTINRWIDAEVKDAMEFYHDLHQIVIPKPFKMKKELTKDELLFSENPFLFSMYFTDTKFLVFDRAGSKLSEDSKYFTKYFDETIASMVDDGISSTKIREGIYQSKL